MVRVTNNMMVNTLLRNLNNNAARMGKYQEQMSSQTKINNISDDPLGAIISMRARSNRANLEIYQRDLDSAHAWMTAGETSLMDVNNIFVTMYEDAVNLATDAKTGYDRQLAANKVREFRDELVHTLNSSISDKYLFGGYNSLKPPFEVINNHLYYNSFRMDASETSEFNFEHFQAGMADIMHQLARDLNPPTNKEVTVAMMEKTQGYIDQMLNAANIAYKQRGAVPDDIREAMRAVLDGAKVELDNDTSPHSVYNDALKKALDSVMALAEYGAADENAPEQTDTKLLMDNLGVLSGVSKEMIDLAKTLEDGGSWRVADLLAPKAEEYGAKAALAVEYMDKLEAESNKSYEIVVGFGLTMDVCMNGVDIAGVGSKNLYKVLNDMYDSLMREYVDYSLDDDYVTADAMGYVEDFINRVADTAFPGTDAAKQEKIFAALDTLVEDILQAGIDAGKVTDAEPMDIRKAINAALATIPAYAPIAVMDKVAEYINTAVEEGLADDPPDSAADMRDKITGTLTNLAAVIQAGIDRAGAPPATADDIRTAMDVAILPGISDDRLNLRIRSIS